MWPVIVACSVLRDFVYDVAHIRCRRCSVDFPCVLRVMTESSGTSAESGSGARNFRGSTTRRRYLLRFVAAYTLSCPGSPLCWAPYHIRCRRCSVGLPPELTRRCYVYRVVDRQPCDSVRGPLLSADATLNLIDHVPEPVLEPIRAEEVPPEHAPRHRSSSAFAAPLSARAPRLGPASESGSSGESGSGAPSDHVPE